LFSEKIVLIKTVLIITSECIDAHLMPTHWCVRLPLRPLATTLILENTRIWFDCYSKYIGVIRILMRCFMALV